MAICVLVGLGNPGQRYAGTRHNLGRFLIERFGAELQAEWKAEPRLSCEYAKVEHAGRTLYLVKPLKYMNESGIALAQFSRYYKLPPAQHLIAYDDITLSLGRLRVTLRGSAGGHNGVADLLQHFGNGFTRYRIGIGSRQDPDMPLSDWVLGKMTPAELALIESEMPHYLDGLRQILQKGTEQAMNQLNQRTSENTTDDSSSK